MGNLWRICVKVREPIELPFGLGMGVLNFGGDRRREGTVLG